MKTSPTQLSLRYMRKQNYKTGIVEHWNSFAHIRQDLFGWIDIVCVGNGKIVGIQTTSRSNMEARRKKARGNAALKMWLDAGGLLYIHGWAKVKGRYEPAIHVLCSDDIGDGH